MNLLKPPKNVVSHVLDIVHIPCINGKRQDISASLDRPDALQGSSQGDLVAVNKYHVNPVRCVEASGREADTAAVQSIRCSRPVQREHQLTLHL